MSEHETGPDKASTAASLEEGPTLSAEAAAMAAETPSLRNSARQVLTLIAVGVAILLAIWLLGRGLPSSFGAGGLASSSADTGRIAAEVGSIAPDFTLKDMQGKEVKLSSLQGKTVLVNFWATWCPPCRSEMPDLDAFYRDNQEKNVVVLAVNMREDQDTVARFIQSTPVTFSVLLDAEGEAERLYNVNYLPTTFFVDPGGVIREMHIGAMNRSTMDFKAQQAR